MLGKKPGIVKSSPCLWFSLGMGAQRGQRQKLRACESSVHEMQGAGKIGNYSQGFSSEPALLAFKSCGCSISDVE